MIVPTGIGCEIGGYCGDGNAPARLLGACCETMVLQPSGGLLLKVLISSVKVGITARIPH
jgi:hypothetical protein